MILIKQLFHDPRILAAVALALANTPASAGPTVHVNFDSSASNRTDLVGPAGGGGETWNQTMQGTHAAAGGFWNSNVLDSTGKPTGIGWALSRADGGPLFAWNGSDDAALSMLKRGISTNSDVAHTLTLTGLNSAKTYDLYITGYTTGSTNQINHTTSNTSATSNPQMLTNTGQSASWVMNDNYVVFGEMAPDGSGTITINMVKSSPSGFWSGFQLIGFDPQVPEPTTDPWAERTPGATEKPVTGQFFARNPETGFGTVYYNGTQSGTPDTVYLKVYKTPSGGIETLDATHRQPLVGGAYAFSAPIAAGRNTYRVVYGTTVAGIDSDVTTVSNLMCGDAYIIQGQSNAVATDNSAPDDSSRDPWVRTYGRSGGGWGAATRKGSEMSIGFWGMELARRIVTDHQMPVCFINGAVGGTRIDQHQANPANPTVPGSLYSIYANLLNRVIGAKLTHGIRGIFWHQGESDCSDFGPISGYDYTAYEQNFVNLSTAWKRDYPNFQRSILFQVMPKPCAIGPTGDQLREVQRNLPRLYPNMSILNTLGIAGYEGCHFSRLGYEAMANRMLPVVRRDFYGATPGANVTAPNLRRAYFTSSARIAIAMEFDQDMTWNGLSLSNFFLDDLGGRVILGSASRNIVTIQLTRAAFATAKLDYLQDDFWNPSENGSSLLTGANGIPALTFAGVSVGVLTPYESWIASKNLSGISAAGEADPDFDGLKNALEFVLGGEPNPSAPGSNSSALLPVSTHNSTGDLMFSFRRKLASVSGVNLAFQWSGNLTFQAPNTVPIGAANSTTDGITVAISNHDVDTQTILITVPAAKATGGRIFGRLQAVAIVGQ